MVYLFVLVGFPLRSRDVAVAVVEPVGLVPQPKIMKSAHFGGRDSPSVTRFVKMEKS